jgi:hypothetical protein
MNNTELLQAISRAVNDATFAKRSKAVMLGILTDAQNYIIDKTECLRQIDSTSVTLVASTSAYNLPASFVKFPVEGSDVKRGFVSIGTTGKFPLTFIPMTILNSHYPNWRNTTTGTPEWYSLIETGTPQLVIYPTPSAAFITANGAVVFMDMIYKPDPIIEDTNMPFDNAYRFTGLFQRLLKLSAIWQIKLEDMQFNDENRLDRHIDKLMEEATDFVRSIAVSPGNHGFEEQLR